MTIVGVNNSQRLKNSTADMVGNLGRLYQKNLEIAGKMRGLGVQFLAGTDSGSLVYPGFSLHDELELLVVAGFSPQEALRSATLNPALFLGKEKELGTVEKGKIADLVLLDANPLENISNTRKIAAVVVNGQYLPQELLQKMVKDTKVPVNKN